MMTPHNSSIEPTNSIGSHALDTGHEPHPAAANDAAPGEPAPAKPDPAAAGEIFAEGRDFASMGLRSSVLKGIESAGFTRPTSIQAEFIPLALTGRDILGQAKTGTGKTAAFGLPLFHMCDKGKPTQALILAPTRELAIQIAAELSELGKFTPIKVAAIYGGQRVAMQADKLQKGPEIIVGTPGRIMDMVERRLLSLAGVRFAVLDEVDRMLDIGFREDIRRILGMCPKERQTMFVSATIGGEIEKLARSYMRDPEKIVVSAGSLTVSLVQQHYLAVQPWDKKRLLAHLLTHEEPALTIVFCRLKRVCDELARYLRDKNIDAHAIHADLPQGKRNTVMGKLRSGQLGVLIASDLASRGIDADGITHVINYDLPEDVDLYVHRIGRTARAGRGGVAWSLVTPEQGDLLTEIEHLINAEIPKLDYPDFEPGPTPAGYVSRDEKRRQREQAGAPQISRYAAIAPPPGAAAAPAAPSHASHAPAAPAPRPDASKYPGGVVPSKLPPKLMRGKVKANRR